jgi:hypothetical protein
MVIMVARDPSLQLMKNQERRAPLAQRFQKQFNQVERAQIGIFNAISHADSKVKSALQPIQTATDQLIDYTHTLCQRMTVLENHRKISKSPAALRAEISELNFNLEAATDPIIQREYKESIQSISTDLANKVALERQLDRTDAQIQSLTNQLNHTLTEIIRLQALEPEKVKTTVPIIVKKLENQLEELKTFSQEISQN